MIKMGQAKIAKTSASGAILLVYKNIGSDLLGERWMLDAQEAAEFIRSHLLVVVR